MATKPKGAPARGGGELRAWLAPANLLTSLVLVLPLLIGYQFGVLFGVGNGADVITGPMVRLLRTPTNYLVFNLVLLAIFGVLLAVMRGKQQFHVRMFVPVLVESGLYALSMGSLIIYVMHAIGISPKLLVNAVGVEGMSVPARIATALGAGVHEELVFRLAMIPALALLFEKVGGVRRWMALAIAFVISSVLFSAAHHVIGGEPWHLGPFVYRFFCGMLFAALFQFRGLAVAVYTHALYDIYVMLFQA